MSKRNDESQRKLDSSDTKKIKDFTPEEKRKYNREKQQERREKKKNELEEGAISKSIKVKDMSPEQKKEVARKRKQDNREKHRASNEPEYHKKIADQRQKHRDQQMANAEKRSQAFKRSVLFGRIFDCVCCHRRLFEDAVKKIKDETEFKNKMEEKFPGLFKLAINKIVTKKAPQGIWNGKPIEATYHICGTCNGYLKKGKMPPMSHQNNLQIVDRSNHPELHLSEVENSMIALNLIFQKIYQLPKSRNPAMKDKTINIPINESDVLQTVESLPRTPTEAGIIPVKLKRKLEYKNSHLTQYVSVVKVCKALQTLKNMGNKYYQFVPEAENFKEKCRASDIEGFNLLFPDEDETTDDPGIRNKEDDKAILDTDEDPSVPESDNAEETTHTLDIFKNLDNLLEKIATFQDIINEDKKKRNYNEDTDTVLELNLDSDEEIILKKSKLFEESFVNFDAYNEDTSGNESDDVYNEDTSDNESDDVYNEETSNNESDDEME